MAVGAGESVLRFCCCCIFALWSDKKMDDVRRVVKVGESSIQIQKPRLALNLAAAPFPLDAEPSLDLATNSS